MGVIPLPISCAPRSLAAGSQVFPLDHHDVSLGAFIEPDVFVLGKPLNLLLGSGRRLPSTTKSDFPPGRRIAFLQNEIPNEGEALLL